jgi:hypothetical protein
MASPPRRAWLVGPDESVELYASAPAPVGTVTLDEAFALSARAASKKDRAVEIVLSDAHCRYLVMARPQGVRNRAELSAAMHSRFNAMFGDVESWSLRHEAAPGASHDLVVGVKRELLDRIDELERASGLRVASVRPHWIAWARHFQRETRRGHHWVVASHGGWASLGYLADGQCLLARSLRLPSGEASFESLVSREKAFLADPVETLAPVWCGGTGIRLPFAGPMPVVREDTACLWPHDTGSAR